jgi:Methyltransferase domain
MRQVLDMDSGCRVLEIGSGAIGLGEFWRHPFVGCDVSFAEKPRAPMQPVKCSGSRLPFADRSFDAVVASDVMEHIPPEWRRSVVSEALRVSRRVVVIGYPSGPSAMTADRDLREWYLKKKKVPPTWLEEHMMHPFPNGGLFSEVGEQWTVKAIPNEGVQFHLRMMHLEMYRPIDQLFRLGLLVVPSLFERFLIGKDSEPSYRKIFVLCRQSS